MSIHQLTYFEPGPSMLYYDDGGSLVPSCLFSCPESECWFVESLKKTIIMKPKFTKALPKIVSAAEWQIARDRLLAKEKAHTRAGDALAAERRRLPMVEISKAYQFDSSNGRATLLDLFEARRQLIVYHFMFAPNVCGWPSAGCDGCSWYADNVGNLSHLHARDTSFVMISRAPLPNILAYKKRMGWNLPWVSSSESDFNVDFGISTSEGETSGTSVFLRDGDRIFRTYFTTGRGDETLGNFWTFLDLTPFGRQEIWEDSPEGWPQSEPYVWWRRHDEYGDLAKEAD
jgi:predicted dithiol-disulfide oxidoreductase (DUF899 family)